MSEDVRRKKNTKVSVMKWYRTIIEMENNKKKKNLK